VRIHIIHYHLNPGGVTRIIESQVRALSKKRPASEIILYTGDCHDPGYFHKLGATLIIDKQLNYLPANSSTYAEKYIELKDFFTSHIASDDIIHFHNLNLGKNPLLTLVISDMAYSGIRVFNHVHDFAEDRADNIEFLKEVIEKNFQKDLASVLYPDLRDYHYITLTKYDFDRLAAFGISKSRLNILPNPVVLKPGKQKKDAKALRHAVCLSLHIDEGKLVVTYPVRAIRRKNLGEFILLSALLKNEANWVVTLPPLNPNEIELYQKWKTFCTTENIPVVFEAGNMVAFEELMQASDLCITTSVREGFGMVFMEPWLFNVPVAGRDIPPATTDLNRSGIIFPLLYSSINVSFEGMKTDFAKLPVHAQMQFIHSILESKGDQTRLLKENPILKKLLTSIDNRIIEKNKIVIRKKYSLANYAKRLERIYQKAAR
jgi:glycosyltransferase involved in cell wall biosynthesis